MTAMTTTLVESPRFTVQPSGLLPGWWAIHDHATGLLAKAKSRVIFRPEDRERADRLADRMNRDLTRRAICRSCRHRRLAVEMFTGQCKECRS